MKYYNGLIIHEDGTILTAHDLKEVKQVIANYKHTSPKLYADWYDKNGKHKRKGWSNLVAEAFSPDDKPYAVKHINGDFMDCRLENLKSYTKSEAMKLCGESWGRTLPLCPKCKKRKLTRQSGKVCHVCIKKQNSKVKTKRRITKRANELKSIDHAELTNRQKEVLDLRNQGLTQEQIGSRLKITRQAVAYHLSNIKKITALRGDK